MKKTKVISLVLLFILFIIMLFGIGLKHCSHSRLDEFITKDHLVDTILKDPAKSYDTIDIIRATTYNAVTGQCDSTPFNTADGSFIDANLLYEKELRWVALSRDLIKDEYRDGLYMNRNHWRGYFKFGDTIVVSSVSSLQINGKWVVHDCMAPKYKKSVDFLFDPRNNNPKLGVCTDLKIRIKNE